MDQLGAFSAEGREKRYLSFFWGRLLIKIGEGERIHFVGLSREDIEAQAKELVIQMKEWRGFRYAWFGSDGSRTIRLAVTRGLWRDELELTITPV